MIYYIYLSQNYQKRTESAYARLAEQVKKNFKS